MHILMIRIELMIAYSIYSYLPIEFVDFILEKYVLKTQLKNVEGKEVEYAREKGAFNSLYGMTVTNTSVLM